jgi:ribosomal protein S18 acetylase RimI-like enzyme
VAPAAIHLRLFQRSDFEALYRIDQACFPKGIAYGRLELKLYLGTPGSHCVIAEISDEIAGFILTERSGQRAHIITLDVLDAYRRRAIGAALLEAAEVDAQLHEVDRVYLETATTNEPAIAFWRKHGYREFGTIADYYGPGQNAFAMEKRIGTTTRSERD